MWGLLGIIIGLVFSLVGWIARLAFQVATGSGPAGSFVTRHPLELLAAGVLAILAAHVVWG
ncbi:hypothetical protein [Rhodospira trueperi]|uniref:Uncharacterized protein n=1 Tax=Rhodospira trueperi TaxID=69960 RepID=A0A1G7HHR5_9PROT|nr:hypothetical protein [Rhodospira trueperi]SDE99866.1 hypothetical protein SAMN05421720_12117 [Rhodospira trueperi]